MTRRAITICYNDQRDAAWLFERCYDSIERYAKRTGSDLLIKRIHGDMHYLDKYAMVKTAQMQGYDRILQLDADIYIHTDEDIFEVAGDARFAARRTERTDGDKAWFGGFKEDWTWNAGVLVSEPAILANFFDFADPHRAACWGDEVILVPYLQYAQIDVLDLPRRFNLWANWTNPALRGDDKGFFHFSGPNKQRRWNWFEKKYLA